MTVDELERRRAAAEWDGAWFCDDCEKMEHWKKKAYVVGNKNLCRACAEKKLKKVSKNP